MSAAALPVYNVTCYLLVSHAGETNIVLLASVCLSSA